MIREETTNGVLEFGRNGEGNELIVDAKNDDPAAIRGGRPTPGIAFKISGDIWIPDPNDPLKKIRYERVFVGLGTDGSGGYGGQFQIQAMLPGQHGDVHTKKLLTVDTRQILCHVPLVVLAGLHDTERTWPWENYDPTHGIPAGDFAAVLAAYGMASDDEQPYRDGRMSWELVIERMDIRDNYRHFPKPSPPTLPLPTPGPPPIDAAERAERVLDVEALAREFPGMDLNNVESYLQGRSSLEEFHDENAARAETHDESFHRPGRPYSRSGVAATTQREQEPA
jgi:hypothetical protein